MLNRDILFRGKRLDYGLWVEGSYVYNFWKKGEHTIHLVDGGSCIVDPVTVGQYTGLNGKDGVKIFDGDILQAYDGRLTISVKWYPEDAGFNLMGLNTKAFDVVGNIHDNPELLERGKDNEIS